MRSYVTLAQGLVCVLSPHPIHACVRGCLSVFFFLSFYLRPKFLFHLFLIPAMVPDENSMEDPLCNSVFGSMVSLDYVTPDTGYEPKDMELADTNELNLATSSEIYFQNALDDTASFPNVPDVDDDELAKLLAIVVDRTGQPVEVRSNNDQFSCSVRNVKSAQNQFPFVAQSKRMIDRTEGLVEERIAEERESSNAQIRTLLNEQRKTIIAEYCEKVLHHESLAAQAEQDRRILQEE